MKTSGFLTLLWVKEAGKIHNLFWSFLTFTYLFIVSVWLLVCKCTLVCIFPCHGGCVGVRGQPLSHFSISTLCPQEIIQVTKFGGKYLDTESSHQYTGYIVFQFKTFSQAPVWYLLMFPVEFLCHLVLLSLSHSVGANWTANVDNCCLGSSLHSLFVSTCVHLFAVITFVHWPFCVSLS